MKITHLKFYWYYPGANELICMWIDLSRQSMFPNRTLFCQTILWTKLWMVIWSNFVVLSGILLLEDDPYHLGFLVCSFNNLTHSGWDKMVTIFWNHIFKHIFLNENGGISIQISLKFVPKFPIDNNPALLKVMAFHLFGAKPLSKMMLGYCQLDPLEQTSVKFW